MAKINSLATKLSVDFPQLQFVASDDFYWSPKNNTVHFDASATISYAPVLLHEVAHGLLAHKEYRRDIDLLKIEREAWEYTAVTLAPRYSVTLDTETIEDMIDSYREWLHARSTCPSCSMTGVQSADSTYHCVGCASNWKVNEARRCGLKRYTQ